MIIKLCFLEKDILRHFFSLWSAQRGINFIISLIKNKEQFSNGQQYLGIYKSRLRKSLDNFFKYNANNFISILKYMFGIA